MTNDYFAEALQEINPPDYSLMAQVAQGHKVFAPRTVDEHAFDNDWDAKHQDKLTGYTDSGYFG